MATIGLDKLYYAKITEDENGFETYATPVQLAKAMTADLSVELAEATLYADDGASEIVKEFKSGTLSLGVDDIGTSVASDLTGATIDSNGVIISASEDGGTPVAVGFRAKKSNGKYKYYWLYRVKFGIPATNLATKGDSITFSTPTIEGTILRRNKVDTKGKHPWKAEVTEGDTSVAASTITNWYKEVYEPSFTDMFTMQMLIVIIQAPAVYGRDVMGIYPMLIDETCYFLSKSHGKPSKGQYCQKTISLIRWMLYARICYIFQKLNCQPMHKIK